jgi:hypothetical protein
VVTEGAAEAERLLDFPKMTISTLISLEYLWRKLRDTNALPPRSLNEFRFWLQRYGACAEVIYPSSLRQLHDEEAIALSARYSKAK